MDSNTRALITQSQLTLDDAMRLINERHARTPLTPDQVYVFGMTLSGQALDSYVTRMGRSTLQNYAVDFTAGRALMNSHRSGGFMKSAELPIGRTFATDLSGDFLPDDAAFDAAGGARLDVFSYIQRDLQITDVATNDLIKGIDGGTINDTSVGFSMGMDGLYRCSICSKDMTDWWSDDGCLHMPGVMYDEGRAFAWVDNAHGREASLVYMGANPQAMITKAIRMVEGGRLSRSDALVLEERYGERILGDKSFAAARPTPTGSVSHGKATDVTTLSVTRKDTSMDWEKFLAELRAIDAAQADRIAALPEGERAVALIAVMREQRTAIDGLTPRAAMGDRWLDDLVDQAVKARVRAEASAFDGEKYRKFLRGSNDVDTIRAELASWERQAKAVLGDGKRPTAGKTDKPAPQRGVYK